MKTEILNYEEKYYLDVATLLAEFRSTLKEFKGIKEEANIEDAKEELVSYVKEKWPIFIAIKDYKVVGYILLRVDGVVWVEHIFVLEKYQRQGIGSKLFEKAEEYSNNLKEDTVFNWVHPNNTKIINFLKSKGYSVLNLIEVRKPYNGEKPSIKIKVGDNEFDY